ncbi:hypothetical protein ACIRJO_14130 [Streptomyces sp. NPDC102394]
MVTRTGLLPRWVGRSGTTALMGALLSWWLPAVGICVYAARPVPDRR